MAGSASPPTREAAGATSLIVADLPASKRPGYRRVQLVAPRLHRRAAPPRGRADRRLALPRDRGPAPPARASELSPALTGLVKRARAATDLPLYAGFGISTPGACASGRPSWWTESWSGRERSRSPRKAQTRSAGTWRRCAGPWMRRRLQSGSAGNNGLVSDTVLIDARNVQRSRWPNLSDEELVERARSWAGPASTASRSCSSSTAKRQAESWGATDLDERTTLVGSSGGKRRRLADQRGAPLPGGVARHLRPRAASGGRRQGRARDRRRGLPARARK